MKTLKQKILRILSIILLLIIGAGVPLLVQQQRMIRKQICFGNLRPIDHAINCGIAMSKRLTIDAPVKPEDVAEYCRGGVIPRCPSGAKYEIDYHVGRSPICPIHGDLLLQTGYVPHEELETPLELQYFPAWVLACVGASLTLSILLVALWIAKDQKLKGTAQQIVSGDRVNPPQER